MIFHISFHGHLHYSLIKLNSHRSTVNVVKLLIHSYYKPSTFVWVDHLACLMCTITKIQITIAKGTVRTIDLPLRCQRGTQITSPGEPLIMNPDRYNPASLKAMKAIFRQNLKHSVVWGLMMFWSCRRRIHDSVRAATPMRRMMMIEGERGRSQHAFVRWKCWHNEHVGHYCCLISTKCGKFQMWFCIFVNIIHPFCYVLWF